MFLCDCVCVSCDTVVSYRIGHIISYHILTVTLRACPTASPPHCRHVTLLACRTLSDCPAACTVTLPACRTLSDCPHSVVTLTVDNPPTPLAGRWTELTTSRSPARTAGACRRKPCRRLFFYKNEEERAGCWGWVLARGRAGAAELSCTGVQPPVEPRQNLEISALIDTISSRLQRFFSLAALPLGVLHFLGRSQLSLPLHGV